MLNQAKHKVALIEILKDFYADPELRTILGFKGGTAAMLFYNLPRLSVDLDFDLLDTEKKEVVFNKIKTILQNHGILREAREKKFSLFFLISYEKGEHTIKVEISKRTGVKAFHLQNYLGVPMLVMKKDAMIAGKLSAFLTRKRFAMRDAFDLCIFLKNHWTINETLVSEKTELPFHKALEQAITKASTLNKKQLLHGLGELLDSKQKVWVKEKLGNELVFQLRLYQEADK